MKKLIMKTVIRVISFAVITALLATLKESAVITNDIAIGQLENSDTAYIFMQSVQNLGFVVTLLYIVFAAIIFCPVISDAYKFIKTKYFTEEVEK